MKVNKKLCPLCGQLISASNYERHQQRHIEKPESFRLRYHLDHEDLKCKYCGKNCKNKNSLVQHELRCRLNPERIKITPSAPIEGFNNKGNIPWNKGLTKYTDKRVEKYGKHLSQLHKEGKFDYSKNKHSEETKEKIRQQKLELCAKKGTNLCGKGLRGYYKGYYCQSSWELAYVIYQLEHNVRFVRNSKRFPYIIDGIERSYFPDFYIPDIDTYIEIKGYYDKKTKCKVEQFKGNLKVLQLKEMKPILKYVEDKYGKDFVKLYDISFIKNKDQ